MIKLVLDLVDVHGHVWKTRPFTSQKSDLNLRKVAAVESARYCRKHMLNCELFQSAMDLLSYALSRVTFPGIFCEFGVASGKTINHIARASAGNQIHGFDGFVGLPENWRNGYPAGAFAQAMPAVEPNVKLHAGQFSETLPQFAASLNEDVAFLHVDCDLYSSTKDIFANLGSRIKPGTVIVFDEYMNYPGWQYHEWKAFREFISSSNLKYKYIGLVPSHQEVAVVIE
jgi:Methyltransferase domain